MSRSHSADGQATRGPDRRQLRDEPLPQDLTAAVEREDHSHEAGLRAKRVRPPRSVQRQKQLCVSMDRDTLREIDGAATAEKLTRSEWVRQRLEWALMGDPA